MEISKTITSIFFVPTLDIPQDALKNNGFINGYIKDSKIDHIYPDSVYILFRPRDLNRFREFLDREYERTKSVIEDYDYPDGFVVVVYKLDIQWAADFHKIRQGRYSKTSQGFQNLFRKKVKIIVNGLSREEYSLQYRIFNKTQDMIDFWEEKLGMKLYDNQEVWNGFMLENETMDIDKITDNVRVP